MTYIQSHNTFSPFTKGLSVLRPEKITREKPILKVVEKIPAISKVDPPSPELIEKLNRIASQPPFCYVFKARTFDPR
jgi:hypothetical protein